MKGLHVSTSRLFGDNLKQLNMYIYVMLAGSYMLLIRKLLFNFGCSCFG